MNEIVQTGEKVLRETAKEVPLADIGSAKLKKILADMNEALDSQDDGVAIAAPQIGVALRIFIVSRKALPKKGGVEQENQIYINPIIKKLSAKKSNVEEGCLSVRWIYGETKRADTAQVEAYNENGHKFARQGSGLLAQIFQHETDHLNGVLFTDIARKLHEVHPEDMGNDDE